MAVHKDESEDIQPKASEAEADDESPSDVRNSASKLEINKMLPSEGL